MELLEYVDVRGVWPIYIKGVRGVVLEGKKRDITLAEARIVASAVSGQ